MPHAPHASASGYHVPRTRLIGLASDSTARIESKAELDTSLAVGEEAGDAELKVGAEFDAASPNEGESVLPPTSQHGHTCVWGQALPVQLPSLASVSQGGLPDVFIRLELVGMVGRKS